MKNIKRETSKIMHDFDNNFCRNTNRQLKIMDIDKHQGTSLYYYYQQIMIDAVLTTQAY